MRFITTVMAVLFLSIPAWGSDLYVTATRPSPFGNGSLSTPFRNVSSALRAAQPGDTIRLMAGVYGKDFVASRCTDHCTGVVTPVHGGTAGNPITITSYPTPLSAIIDGSNQAASCIYVAYPNIVIDGLEVRNCSLIGIQADGDTYGSYDPALSYGNWGGYGTRLYNANGIDNLIIRNNYIHDCKMDAVKTGHGNNVLVENNNMYNVSTTPAGHSTMQMNGIYGGIVRNNWMHDDLTPPNPSPHLGFFAKGGSANILFENNRIENMVAPFAGIEIGENMEWYNIRYTPSEIPGLNSRILSETDADNEIMPSPTGTMYAHATTYQPEVLAEARNVTVRGNIVINCDPPLSSRNGYNVTWYNNTVVNGGGTQSLYKLWTDGYNGFPSNTMGEHNHLCKNERFFNNLFFNDTVPITNFGIPGRAYYVKDKDGDYSPPLMNEVGLAMDYNQYYNMGFSWFSANIPTPVDSHALFNVHPYLDATYHPAPGNRALSSGGDLRALGVLGATESWKDRDGVTRPTTSELANGYGIGALTATDTTPPVVTDFTVYLTPNASAAIPVAIAATDDVAVTAYCIQTTNSANGCTWQPSLTSYQPIASGVTTLFAFARDAAGNVSAGRASNPLNLNQVPCP
ncbi:right-handed parallel beta-helix repeat-containing protein [Geomesophilobacter sediminis]|uniref:Right-handed parallel beta-helix repeat-containing protein n=1 Tax=Geomesophilobacter sediminis TaxID=2798584 RepID=A0A8J7J029_9BACT|nr:right-handed parallel beta-helix repeat-containing protein [Geomesophilobacter sediminis]MBJ6723688.1 right-handed parallel beta-helix repeat-containing protein [Geomesophilobacter sediminis]